MISVKITNEWTKVPSGREIFGNFIESGFGRQTNGLWSEMIENRAFRQVPPYKDATWEWLGLEKEYYNSNAPFWHSGYEVHDWELIGNPGCGYTCGTHTYKGRTCFWIENKEEGTVCGVRQEGLHLQREKQYQLRLFAGVRGELGEAGLNGFGNVIQEENGKILTVQIGSVKKEFGLSTISQLYEWEFQAEKTEITSISLKFCFSGVLMLSFISMMPTDNLCGWRRDAVELLQKAAPSVVRFPGGCYASFYQWEDTVGSRDVREPMESFYWGGLEENDVGLDEFLQLSRLVGFEPQICFNMMTSNPFRARMLVEYLNAPHDCGYGRLRALNGNEAPWCVRLFEMDNEPARKWTAVQYAQKCVEFAREMRLADPSIEFMMACYTHDVYCLPKMLDIAGKDIQYVIYRQGDPEFVTEILQFLRTYNREHQTAIRLVNTEWLPSCCSMEPFEDPGIPMNFSWMGKITNDYHTIFSTQQISWNYALNGAHRLLDYISYGGEFASANFNNMCNTWGQNILEATKDGCYLSCMGQVFAFFHRVFKACVSAVADIEDAHVFGLFVKTQDREQGLYLINHSSEAAEVDLPFGDYKQVEAIRGISRMGHETENQNCVFECKAVVEKNRGILPALSIVYLRREQ